jgi:hypothetical protein
MRGGFLEAFKPPEQANGMLAVIATGSAEFVKDKGFCFTRGIFIPYKDRLGVFSF